MVEIHRHLQLRLALHQIVGLCEKRIPARGVFALQHGCRKYAAGGNRDGNDQCVDLASNRHGLRVPLPAVNVMPAASSAAMNSSPRSLEAAPGQLPDRISYLYQRLFSQLF